VALTDNPPFITNDEVDAVPEDKHASGPRAVDVAPAYVDVNATGPGMVNVTATGDLPGSTVMVLDGAEVSTSINGMEVSGPVNWTNYNTPYYLPVFLRSTYPNGTVLESNTVWIIVDEGVT
jgi:hypothetical protein